MRRLGKLLVGVSIGVAVVGLMACGTDKEVREYTARELELMEELGIDPNDPDMDYNEEQLETMYKYGIDMTAPSAYYGCPYSKRVSRLSLRKGVSYGI